MMRLRYLILSFLTVALSLDVYSHHYCAFNYKEHAVLPQKAGRAAHTQIGKENICRSEEGDPTFVFKVWMKSSDALQISLNEHPKIYYAEGMLVLETKNQSMELDTADVYKFTIENKTSVSMPEPSYNLFVWLKDGHYDTYAFKDKPKVTYADGNLVVDSQWGSYQYAHEQVWKLTLLDSDTPLATMLPSQPSPLPLKGQLSRQGDILSMKGLEPYSELFIYSSDGRLYGVYKATAEGELQINLADELPAGAYLLKTDKITFKIIKK